MKRSGPNSTTMIIGTYIGSKSNNATVVSTLSLILFYLFFWVLVFLVDVDFVNEYDKSNGLW